MNILGAIGAATLARLRKLVQRFAVLGTVLARAGRRASWSRITRDVFARQVLFTGVEALKFVSLIALMAGISVVVQAHILLRQTGQAALLGPLLVTGIIREAAPLLVNLIIIGRSGTAMAAELANMRIGGEIHVLEAQGISILDYLVMPRVLAMAVAAFALTMWFVIVAFTSGYAFGVLAGVPIGDPDVFANLILRGVRPADVYNLLTKTLIPGMFTAVICATEGLSVQHAITEVPQAVTRAVTGSMTALFIILIIISVLTYV